MKEKYQGKLDFFAVKDPNAYVGEADIITLVTNSTEAVIDGNLVKEGTHINSIGSYTPSMQETPVEVLKKASKIYFDTYEGVVKEAGDVIIALEEDSDGQKSEEKCNSRIYE